MDKKTHKVSSLFSAEKWLLENGFNEKEIVINQDSLTVHPNENDTIIVSIGETMNIEGKFEDGTYDFWVIDND